MATYILKRRTFSASAQSEDGEESKKKKSPNNKFTIRGRLRELKELGEQSLRDSRETGFIGSSASTNDLAIAHRQARNLHNTAHSVAHFAHTGIRI